MKSSRTLSSALCLLGCAAVAHSSAFAADQVLRKVPALSPDLAPKYPQNLARYHLGAQVEAGPKSQPIAQLKLASNAEDNNAAEAALLCDDPSVGYALSAGTTTLLVSLPKVENVGSIAFLNKGAKGAVTVAVANAKLPANSPQWQTALQSEMTNDGVRANIGPAEAKYVRLTFNVTEPGRIAGLGIYATPQVADFTTPRAHQWTVQEKSDSFSLISYNLNDLHAKARALYVSSGDTTAAANNIIDDQTSTSYTFATEDGAPTTIIDMGRSATLRRLSAVYTPRAGTVRFYALQSLPGAPADAAPEGLKLDETTLAALHLVGVVNDDGTSGRAAVDFPATSARYVMVRWTPAEKGSAFAVSEVAAFGNVGSGTMVASNNGLTFAQMDAEASDGKTMIDGKTMMDGKSMIEAKDMPAEGPASPAEGPAPTLPQPPPFTFVPILVPTSP